MQEFWYSQGLDSQVSEMLYLLAKYSSSRFPRPARGLPAVEQAEELRDAAVHGELQVQLAAHGRVLHVHLRGVDSETGAECG